MSIASPTAPLVVRLSRGGTLVQTSIGAVQFGAPPETIKDALSAKLQVPSIFVMPRTWFSKRRGLTVAELEFPVYYNYFMLGRRVTAVCGEDEVRRLSGVLRESLFGPADPDASLDYAPGMPVAARADLRREAEWFRRINGDPDRHIELEDVLTFAPYDASGRADLGGGVIVERREDGWTLHDGGVVLAEVEDGEPVADPPLPPPALVATQFTPPAFGITVLGSSHGFDPSGKTTGFVLWVNRRGILVDPPCDATETLRAAGVPPASVDAVILTHCHADHDAGVFQKVLEAGLVNLYTTPTILGSFLRKYVALTGETEERLRRLFTWRPVTIGGTHSINGGEFRFFYTLHSIPSIGFEVYFGGKSFVYSGDTLYDPSRIEALHQIGVISGPRRDALLNFPWHHSLVLHEAGVPPIHTAAETLATLPMEVKARLRLIHIAEAALPQGVGLRLARTGFENTLELPVAECRNSEALEALEALAQIDLFRDFPVERCREFLTIVHRELYPPGSLIIGQGEPGDRFYILVSGEAAVVRDGVVLKTYHSGDFFGETALVTGAPRSADVRAKSEVVLLAIDKYDFLSFLRGTDLAEALIRLAQNRDLPSWDLMGANQVLRVLSAKQRTQLQAIMRHSRVYEGDVLWSDGDMAGAAWVLDDARVTFHEEGSAPVTLGRGALLGDMESILRRRPVSSRAMVIEGGGAFVIRADDLAAFLAVNPGVLLALSGSQYVEAAG
jgi:CRP-like cAMP-binding protein/ribonuclease BN (tRNA processing enzyme)